MADKDGTDLGAKPGIFTGRSRLMLAGIWVCGLLSLAVSFVPALVTNRLTSLLSAKPRAATWDAVLLLIVAFFIALCGDAVLKMLFSMFKELLLERRVRDVALGTLRKLLPADASFFATHDSARLANRFLRDARISENYLVNLAAELPLALLGIAAVAGIFFAGLDGQTPVIGPLLNQIGLKQEPNAFLAVLVFALAPLQLFFLLFDRCIQRVNRSVLRASDDVTRSTIESLRSVAEFRRGYGFADAMRFLREAYEAHRLTRSTMTRLKAFFYAVSPGITAFVRSIILGVGAWLCVAEPAADGWIHVPLLGIRAQPMSWHDYMGMAMVAMILHTHVGTLVSLVLSHRVTRENRRRIAELASTVPRSVPSGAPDGERCLDGGVRLQGVNVTGARGETLLHDIDLTIADGARVAIAGPSGCGKSTLLRLLVRDIEPASGHVTLGGRDVAALSQETIARHVGFATQDPAILDLTVGENILLGVSNDYAKDLMATIRKCTFYDDLVARGLRSPLPQAMLGGDAWAECLAVVRKDLPGFVAGEDGGELTRFDPAIPLPDATVLENLCFGALDRADGEAGVPEEQTRHLAAGLRRRARRLVPELADMLTACAARKAETDRRLADALGVPEGDLSALLPTLGRGGLSRPGPLRLAERGRVQRELWHVALAFPLRKALDLTDRPKELETAVLRLRGCLSVSGEATWLQRRGVVRFDTPAIARHVPVREALIGGSLPSVGAAHERVDGWLRERLEAAGLLDAMVSFGIASRVGEGGCRLSGGQRMKIGLARVLIKQPRVCIFDEVIAPLDEASRARVFELIDRDLRDRTVLMVTHHLHSLRHVDRIIVLDGGRVVQDGSYEQLAKEEGLFRSLLQQAPGAVAAEEGMAAAPPARPRSVDGARGLFENLPEPYLDLLREVADDLAVPAGAVLFRPGDEGDGCYIIGSGRIEFFRLEGGTPVVMDAYGPGQVFGDVALLGRGVRTLGARAAEASFLRRIPKATFDRVIAAVPEVAQRLLGILAERLTDTRLAAGGAVPPRKTATSD